MSDLLGRLLWDIIRDRVKSCGVVFRRLTRDLGLGQALSAGMLLALQRDALQAAGCDRVFVDKASGKLEFRPALNTLLEQADPETPSWSGRSTVSAARCGT